MRSESSAHDAHVIVVGNTKGGSGKSTVALHIAIALLKDGHRVATVDADCRQRTLSRSIDNRRRWMGEAGLALDLPWHVGLAAVTEDDTARAEARTRRQLAETLRGLSRQFDFVVFDTPGTDNLLMREVHAVADTLVTPINDSFLDFDVIGMVYADGSGLIGEGHYARVVGEARRRRREESGVIADWVVMRNRLASFDSRNNRNLTRGLDGLAGAIGFRVAHGVSERLIFREFFPLGLTALDRLDRRTLGVRPTMSHLAARREIRELVSSLRLPVDERGRRRREARRTWSEAASRPLAELELPLA